MEWIVILFAFIFGITWGSFLNVWIYRIPEGRSVSRGRSACMSCGHKLSALDLVPVLSFLFLGGKCRYCKTKLSWQYPMVELITGILFVAIYFVVGLNWMLWIISIFVITVNLVMAKIDWDTTFIPSILSIPSIIIAAIYGFFAYKINNYKDPLTTFPDYTPAVPTPTFTESLIGGALFFGLLFLIYLISNGGMGLGDALWAGFIGLMLGWKFAFIALFLGTTLSSVFSIIVMVMFRKKIKKLPNNELNIKNQNEKEIDGKFLGMSIVNEKPAIVMGPFLALGMVITWLYGVPNMEWYLGI